MRQRQTAATDGLAAQQNDSPTKHTRECSRFMGENSVNKKLGEKARSYNNSVPRTALNSSQPRTNVAACTHSVGATNLVTVGTTANENVDPHNI